MSGCETRDRAARLLFVAAILVVTLVLIAVALWLGIGAL